MAVELACVGTLLRTWPQAGGTLELLNPVRALALVDEDVDVRRSPRTREGGTGGGSNCATSLRSGNMGVPSPTSTWPWALELSFARLCCC
ncbi:hypothetical protein BKA81DRAFT_347699 [Phyllosticta paracitricarpa]